jgi:hypothetical protein
MSTILFKVLLLGLVLSAAAQAGDRHLVEPMRQDLARVGQSFDCATSGTRYC